MVVSENMRVRDIFVCLFVCLFFQGVKKCTKRKGDNKKCATHFFLLVCIAASFSCSNEN